MKSAKGELAPEDQQRALQHKLEIGLYPGNRNIYSESFTLSKSYPSGDHNLLLAELGISSDARILDVGGGANPFRFAKVVVDMDYSSGNSHRDGSAAPLRDDGVTCIQADIQSLPFKDNAFDFVICLHVLEHVDSPGRACDELMRVAKSGFLETPRKWTEYYAGHPTHRWLVDLVDRCLTFEPVTYNDSPFLNFALPPLWDSPELQRRLFVDFSNIPCVQLAWSEDGFCYRISGCLPDSSSVLFDQSLSISDRSGVLVESGSLPESGDLVESVSLPENLKTPEFIAESHYCFARNLLLWMGKFETGSFHADTALKMVPESEKYQRLSLFYRVLTVDIRDIAAFFSGLGFRGIFQKNSPQTLGGTHLHSLYQAELQKMPSIRLVLAALLCRAFRFLTLRMLKTFRKIVAVFI